MSSWSEQYEARKAARLTEEKSKLNLNLGFGFSSPFVTEHIEHCNRSTVSVKCEQKLKESFKSPITTPQEIDKDVPEDFKKEKSSEIIFKGVVSSSDPWYSTYEAKKAKALDNLVSGRLQSVGGTSGYVGKIEGVEQFSKRNEVTRLMKRFKKEEPAPDTLGHVTTVPKRRDIKTVAVDSDSIDSSTQLECVQTCEDTKTGQTCEDTKTVQTCEDTKTVQTCGDTKTVQTCGDTKTLQTCGDTNYVQTCGDTKTVQTCGNIKTVQMYGDTQCYVETLPVYSQPCSVLSGSTTRVTSSAYSSKPPPPPLQLVLQALPGTWADGEEPASPPTNRPSRPSVPTPGKYGTLYGGAPSPGPNPSRSFQPPGFEPPTPPARRPVWPASQAASNQQARSEKEKKDSFQSQMRLVKADSKLSSSSWQEEYLARKKARLDNK